MSMSEPKSIHAAEDWGVVLQSVPSKHKKEIVKRLGEIFGLDKHDAEQVLANMPLILIDDISFGLAARIKKYFQKLGTVVETTNHEMIKKNCFQIVWPQIPDLAFFLKEDARSSEAPLQEKKADAPPTEAPVPEKKYERPETAQEVQKAQEIPPSAKPAQELPAAVPHPEPIAEEKPQTPSQTPAAASDWERRAHELNEKLRKIQDEKQQLSAQHTEVTEKTKNDFQRQLELEKQKSDEIKKAYEDLQDQARKQEALTQEGEEWRSKAMALSEKVREIETELMRKNSAIEHWVQEKDDLLKRAEKAAELAARVDDLEKKAWYKGEENAALQARVAEFEKNISSAAQELENYRNREQEWLQKASGLERETQEMRESLQSRDAALAQFEKQLVELAEKLRGCETLRQEHGQLVQERATIRKEYDAKLVEQEARLAKIEDENRRYRSRTDRKTAAATRELGEWVRGVDTVRQGLQKLILFLGSESAVLDNEKKFPLRSPLTRGPEAPNSGKS
jgi:DNA repair exonuclease SbcCD ATPase subunit